MKWVVLLPILLLLQGIYALSSPSYPVDEIVGYDMDAAYRKTEFAVFQYGEDLIREGSITHYTQYTGWFAGDIDGDGVDEIISYNNEGDNTRLIFFKYDGTTLVREGEITHYTQYTGWAAGDIDGDGVDEIITYEVEGDTAHFIFFQYNGTLEREGEAGRITKSTGWFAGDIDGDGVDEILTYDRENIYGKTEFAVFRHGDEGLVRVGSITYNTQYTGWLAGDVDGDGVDEVVAYKTEGYTTEFIFFQHDGATLKREGDASHSTQYTGWFLGDIDEALNIVSSLPQETTIKPDDGETLTFSIEAEQSDGASLSYSWELDGSKVATTKEWSYTPDYDDPGLHIVFGIATDGKLSASKEWKVEAGEFNKPPSVAILSPESGDILLKDVDITWEAIDPDGDELFINMIYSNDGGESWKPLALGEENDGRLKWDTRDVNDGEYILRIIASDPDGLYGENLSGSLFIGNLPPEVEFVSPAPGTIGGIRKVAWKVTDTLDRAVSVVLSISSDGGKTRKLLTSSKGNYSSFSWDTVKVTDGRYTLIVTADNKAGKSEQTLEVIIDNPDYGTFYVSSTPKGASIIIDENDSGKTNREVRVPAGYHTIKIQKDGYFLWAEWIEVKQGENPEIRARLTPNLYGFSPAHIVALAMGLLIFGSILLYFRGKR